MNRSTLPFLVCPICSSSLRVDNGLGGEKIEQGTLVCCGCARCFPVESGIPRFIDPSQLTGSDRRAAHSYDRLSPFYGLFTRLAFLPFGGERKARSQILDKLDRRGGRILEVSIGNGANLPYLFSRPGVTQVFGLDISTGQLAQCQSQAARRGWPVELFLGKAESLPFQSGIFDNILHIGGINFFSGKQEAITEMIRVARPGGTIVIADESERLARSAGSVFGEAVRREAAPISTLIPGTVQNLREEGIWRVHGRPHGYCLAFQKPV